MHDEGRLLSRLIMLGGEMRSALASMLVDPSVPPEYKRRARELVRDWDQAGGRFVPEPLSSPVIVVTDELCEKLPESPEPAVRERSLQVYDGERLAERTERILLFLNQHGPQTTVEITEALGLTKQEAYYVLRSASFNPPARRGSPWIATRISALWTEDFRQVYGEPYVGRNYRRGEAS